MKAVRSVLVNVGDPSPCGSLADWQIRWIREEPRYRVLGTARHVDPEFETFTYGDYLWKPAKINLARMGVGDWIFFNETLIVRGEKRRFIIAAFQVLERIEYAQLAAQDLLEDPRYASNAHVHRNRLLPESDTRFALWRGGQGSRLLAEPLLMDRALIDDIGLLDQQGRPWDWEQHDRNGRAFNELQLIGFHTRATRLLDPAQTALVLQMLSDRPVRAEAAAGTRETPSPRPASGGRGGKPFPPLPLGEAGRRPERPGTGEGVRR